MKNTHIPRTRHYRREIAADWGKSPRLNLFQWIAIFAACWVLLWMVI